MRCVLADDEGERLLHWLSRTPGRELVVQERQCIEELCADLFGCYLLQLGWGRAFYAPIAKDHIRRRIILEECFALMGGTGKILGKTNALPIASESMDAVFLPHTLEFANNPQQVLQESDRVLIQGGHLILLGFNPLSIWGLCHLTLRFSNAIPWCGKFLAANQVISWLTVNGFEIEQKRSIMFLPPLHHTYLLNRLKLVEPIIESWLPLDGAVYIIRAVKRTPILTPLELIGNSYTASPVMVSAFKSMI